MSNIKVKIPHWKKGVKDAHLKFANIDKERAITELGFAMQIIEGNQKLQECSAESITNAIINVARTKITLNPVMRLAYLVPRKGKCCLDFSYMGLIGLLAEGKVIKNIKAFNVYEDEEWAYDPINDKMLHRPKYPSSEAEHKARVFKGSYSRAVLFDDSVVYEWMPAWEIDKVKRTSQYYGDGSIWEKWLEEMQKKTVVRRHYKTLIGLSKAKNKFLEDVMDVEYQNMTDEEAKEFNKQKAEKELLDLLALPENQIDYQEQPQTEAKTAFDFQMPEKVVVQKPHIEQQGQQQQQPEPQQESKQFDLSSIIPPKDKVEPKETKQPSAIEKARPNTVAQQPTQNTAKEEPIFNTGGELDKPNVKGVVGGAIQDAGLNFTSAFEAREQEKQAKAKQVQEESKPLSAEDELGFSLNFDFDQQPNSDSFIDELNEPKKFRFEK